MTTPSPSAWYALSLEMQEKIIRACNSASPVTLLQREGISLDWCNLSHGLFVKYYQQYSHSGVGNHSWPSLSNDIRDYYQKENSISHFSSSNHLNSSHIEQCFDDFWCPGNSSQSSTQRWLLGYLTLILCVLGLIGNLLFLPVFNLVGIHSSATVFLTAIALVDCVWLIVYAVMTTVLYFPDTRDAQVLMYENVQAHLVPLAWPLSEYLESLTFWLLLFLLLDRVHQVRHRVNVYRLFNRGRAVKIVAVVVTLLGLIGAPRLARYRVSDKASSLHQASGVTVSRVHPQSDMHSAANTLFNEEKSARISSIHVESTEVSHNIFYIGYLVGLKLVVEIVLPVTLLVLLLCYLLVRLMVLSRSGKCIPPSGNSSESELETWEQQAPPSLAVTSKRRMLMECFGPVLRPLGDKWRATRRRLGRRSDNSASTDDSQESDRVADSNIQKDSSSGSMYSLGTLLLPPAIFRRGGYKYFQQLKVEEKLRLREGFVTQLAVGLTLVVLICKIPYMAHESCRVLRWSSPASSPSWLSLSAELFSVVMMVLKPVLYWALAPHMRRTLRDMVCLTVRPSLVHSIHLAGGMGLLIPFPGDNSSSNSGSSRSRTIQSPSRSTSYASSLNQLRRCNSTRLTLLHHVHLLPPDADNLMPPQFPSQEALEEITKQLMYKKLCPFLADDVSGSDGVAPRLNHSASTVMATRL